MTDNPLLHLDFEVPFDRIRAEHVEPASDVLIETAQKRLDAIAEDGEPRTWDNTLGALENATVELERALTVVGHLESVRTTPELREAYNRARPKVSEFFSRIPLHEGLWNALKAYQETGEAASLDPIRKRLLDKTMDEFRRHGADLHAEGKRRLSEIEVELSQLTTSFSQNVLDATNDFELVIEDETRLAGLPESAKEAARESAEARGKSGFRFTLQAPSVIPAITYLDDATIRKTLWHAFNTRATSGERNNQPVIERILELRREKAHLLGYEDFADFVLEDRMAKSGAKARGFVDDLRSRTTPHFEQENADLEAFRRDLEGEDAPALEPWDVAYYAERQRQARFDFDEEEIRPYFPADQVLSGLFEVVQKLYGIRIERHVMPVWHEDVETYAIKDEDGTLLAAFYTDLYPREDKRDGAWMNALVTGVSTDRESTPHLALFCANVSPSVGGKPALLRHREVETLFHEFGHLMHHTLSRVPIRSLAGIRVAWDFVEMPSQIMENWTWEREALDLFARHHETAEPIPASLYEKMQRARTYRAANGMMRQLGFATLDLSLHMDYAAHRDGDVLAYARAILERHAPTKLPDDYAMVAGFSHLFAGSVAYAAGYYSYKWAEVLEADAFSRFHREGVFNPAVGREFRRKVLERGDTVEPEQLFEDFMGRPPRLEALLERDGLTAA
jgi:oligopeptidase A